jgi:hypothetical protein
VQERGRELRQLTYKQLKQRGEASDDFTLQSRRATVSVILQELPSGALRIVVQGFLKFRFFPMGSQVALDGFYKYPDETTAPLTREDEWDFS